jgi:hypothetical protein
MQSHQEFAIFSDFPANIAEDVLALARREMTTAFIEMFGPDIAGGVVEERCA